MAPHLWTKGAPAPHFDKNYKGSHLGIFLTHRFFSSDLFGFWSLSSPKGHKLKKQLLKIVYF